MFLTNCHIVVVCANCKQFGWLYSACLLYQYTCHFDSCTCKGLIRRTITTIWGYYKNTLVQVVSFPNTIFPCESGNFQIATAYQIAVAYIDTEKDILYDEVYIHIWFAEHKKLEGIKTVQTRHRDMWKDTVPAELPDIGLLSRTCNLFNVKCLAKYCLVKR